MANFTEDKIDLVWEKAKIIDGHDATKYRQDAAGAWIQRDEYGTEGNFGWEIDHIFPEALGGNENLANLQPLQWENNRTKADNFPSFSTSVSSDGTNYTKNDQDWRFKDIFIDALKKLYPNNHELKKY